VNADATACYQQRAMRAALLSAVAVVLIACSPQPAAPSSASAEVVAGARVDCGEGNVEACHVACSNNVASACNEAGRSYELGNGVARSGIAANTFYRKACDLGDANGCYNAAYLLENGLAGRQDAGCALALYRRACEEWKHAASCMGAGKLYKGTFGVPRDDARSREAFERACAAGHNAACAELAKN